MKQVLLDGHRVPQGRAVDPSSLEQDPGPPAQLLPVGLLHRQRRSPLDEESPSSGTSSPMIWRRSCRLAHARGPISAVIRPDGAANETPRRTGCRRARVDVDQLDRREGRLPAHGAAGTAGDHASGAPTRPVPEGDDPNAAEPCDEHRVADRQQHKRSTRAEAPVGKEPVEQVCAQHLERDDRDPRGKHEAADEVEHRRQLEAARAVDQVPRVRGGVRAPAPRTRRGPGEREVAEHGRAATRSAPPSPVPASNVAIAGSPGADEPVQVDATAAASSSPAQRSPDGERLIAAPVMEVGQLGRAVQRRRLADGAAPWVDRAAALRCSRAERAAPSRRALRERRDRRQGVASERAVADDHGSASAAGASWSCG